MDTKAEKLDLIEWISKLRDEGIVHQLIEFKKNYSKNQEWWNNLKGEELESINRGLKDFEDGNIHSHDIARKVYEKYL